MKIKQITIAILIAIGLIACTTDKKVSMEDANFDKYFFNEKNIPVVTGKVLNLSEEEIKSTTFKYSIVTPLADIQEKKTGVLNSDGTFELELDYSFPIQQIWFNIGEFLYAGIYANSELFIEINADSLRNNKAYMNAPGVRYLGADGELNTLLNDRVIYKPNEWRKIHGEISQLVYNFKLNFDDVVVKYDSLYTIFHQLDADFIAENPSEYSYLIKNNRMSDYYDGLLNIHRSREISDELLEKINAYTPYLVSNSTWSFYSSISRYVSSRLDKSVVLANGARISNRYDIEHDRFKNYSLLTSKENTLIEEILHQKKLKNDSLPYDTVRFHELSRITYELLKDTLLVVKTAEEINYIDSTFSKGKADMLKLKFSSVEPKEQKLILETVLANTDTKWCKSLIKQDAEKNNEKLDKIERLLKGEKQFNTTATIGEPVSEMSCGAKLYKVDDMSGEELLSNIKLAFEGKALILDFWATWCGPCIMDLPNSKTLHDQLEGEPIEFVYLCTSSKSSLKKWKEKVAELELGGTHLFVESTIESELMGLFSFSGFPSYAFINAKGDYKAGAIKRMSRIEKSDILKLMED